MATTISEMHGIPNNELPDRGREVRGAAAYIPYNNLTRGEFRLSLLLEQTQIYAAAFPEVKEYKKAETLISNALNAGVSNGVSFVSALYDPILQYTAAQIQTASKNTAPASKNGLIGRESLAKGIGALEFSFNFDHDCVQYARKAANAKYKNLLGEEKSWQWWEYNLSDSEHRRFYRAKKAECATRIEIEKIVNDKITDASHHVIYYGLNEAFPPIKNSLVQTKHLFHIGGIQGLANATDLDSSLVGVWSETSILRKNAVSGVGAIGSVNSSFYLSPFPDSMSTQYAAWQKKRTGGVNGAPYVGSVAAITALIVAIGAAVKSAADMQRSLNEKKNGAMSAAQNYGTAALEAKQTDFNEAALPGSASNNNLLLGAAALGAYFLLNEK